MFCNVAENVKALNAFEKKPDSIKNQQILRNHQILQKYRKRSKTREELVLFFYIYLTPVLFSYHCILTRFSRDLGEKPGRKF